MRAEGALRFGEGGDDWNAIEIHADESGVRTTIGPVGVPGVTVESTDRRVRHHYAEVDRARRAAEYRNSPPPPPMFKERKRRRPASTQTSTWEEEPEIEITVKD